MVDTFQNKDSWRYMPLAAEDETSPWLGEQYKYVEYFLDFLLTGKPTKLENDPITKEALKVISETSHVTREEINQLLDESGNYYEGRNFTDYIKKFTKMVRSFQDES
jgi:hypothetical protein